MAFVELKCTSCGADIQLDDSKEFGFCLYCGMKIMLAVQQVKIEGIPPVENLLKRARQFQSQEDWVKVEEYCNRVLDMEPDNKEALEILNDKVDLVFIKKKQWTSFPRVNINIFVAGKTYSGAVLTGQEAHFSVPRGKSTILLASTTSSLQFDFNIKESMSIPMRFVGSGIFTDFIVLDSDEKLFSNVIRK